MIDYYDDNEFIISRDDEYLFNYFYCLFEKIKKYDKNFDSLIAGNTFRWKSENDIVALNISELLIIREENRFIVKFIKNKRNFLSEFHNSCDICFNLNCSKYQEVVHLFSLMYICYEEKTSGKVKSRKL